MRHKAGHGERRHHCCIGNDTKIAAMLAFHAVQEAPMAVPGERTRWSDA
jgi:hypothetical protein